MGKWIPRGADPVMLVNERTQAVLASQVELALTRQARRTGLLGRDGLEANAALVLAPCMMIHTAFMRFAIDVLFVDRDGRAVHLIHELQPWRAAMAARACAAIELPGGALRRHGVSLGDPLRLAGPVHRVL